MTILYIDIETAYETNDYENYDKRYVWEARYCKDMQEGMDYESRYYARASLFAEFSKIVCISLGYERDGAFKLHSLTGNEQEMLEGLYVILNKMKDPVLGGHNINKFDIPFINKRSAILGIPLHPALNAVGKKPREIRHIDIMQLWKMGASVSTGLDTICSCLGLPSPKQEIDGSQVADYYYKGKLEEIAQYCEGDVQAVYNAYKAIAPIIYSVTDEKNA